jgi:hypothetical protein
MYLMAFTKAQLDSQLSKELKKHDRNKKTPNSPPLTSDEALFEINEKKMLLIDQFTRAIKESSIDCSIHPSDENLTCLNFANPTDNYLVTPSIVDDEKDKNAQRNLDVFKWKAEIIENKKTHTKYALRKETGIVYDYEIYKKNRLVRVGQLDRSGKLILD